MIHGSKLREDGDDNEIVQDYIQKMRLSALTTVQAYSVSGNQQCQSESTKENKEYVRE